jgi:hypothetical protein
MIIRKKEYKTDETKAYLKQFLNRLATCLRYRILPVPVVFLRLAFWPQLYERSLAAGYPHWAHSATKKTKRGREGQTQIEKGDCEEIANYGVGCGKRDDHNDDKGCVIWCGVYC